MKKGMAQVTHDGVTVGSAVKRNIGPFNALIVHHYMTGVTSGGYVSLKMSNLHDGQFVEHHGDGSNIKSADVATSYTALFKGLMDHVEITLNRTDGTHHVICQPLVLG